MRQRVPSRAWYSPGRPGRRPRVLIEDDDPALAISDFSRFAQAGFDVAYCSGPGTTPADCPVLQGRPCSLLAGADAVLHGLDPDWGVAAAIRRHHPATAVLVQQPPGAAGQPDAVPDGCVPLPAVTSVPGQIAAVRQALPGDRPQPPAPRAPRPAAPLVTAPVPPRSRVPGNPVPRNPVPRNPAPRNPAPPVTVPRPRAAARPA